MDGGYVELAALSERLNNTDRLHYRLALIRDGAGWHLHTLFLEAFPVGGRAAVPFTYEYDFALFSSGMLDRQMACEWLSQRAGELTPSASDGQAHQFVLYPFSGQINWCRLRSYDSTDFQPAPWPITRYDVTGSSTSVPSTDRGFLLSDDAPFFPDFRTALLKLVYQVDNLEPYLNSSLSPLVCVRIAETEAWLRDIKITPSAIRISVEGSSVGGAQLIVSDAAQTMLQRHLTEAGATECLLSNGVPTTLYVVLSRGGGWLDQYHRDERWQLYQREQDNVEIETPPPSAELEVEALTSGGEGPRVEFKRELADDKKRFLNTVSAFANTAGGTILLGVDDNGVVCGMTGDINRLRDTVTQTIQSNMVPIPSFDIEVRQLNGKTVIVVRVGQTATHACGVNAADPRYYVRRGATNSPATPEEITNLVLLRHPQVPSINEWRGY